MKKLKRWISEYFNPDEFGDLDLSAIGGALNDSSVRIIWLMDCLKELKRIHQEVDKRLLSGNDFGLIDLCARRKAYQDILEAVLSARRQVTQASRPNPPIQAVDLDRVTT